MGLWAPGKLMRLNEAGTVLCNLLKVRAVLINKGTLARLCAQHAFKRSRALTIKDISRAPIAFFFTLCVANAITFTRDSKAAPVQLSCAPLNARAYCVSAAPLRPQGHCAAYRAIKQMPGGQAARVGLVHQVPAPFCKKDCQLLPFEPNVGCGPACIFYAEHQVLRLRMLLCSGRCSRAHTHTSLPPACSTSCLSRGMTGTT